tara:strand:- start:8055 stop:8597 length:543 start_codon:yes stop_codon:yes gene_type:complete
MQVTISNKKNNELLSRVEITGTVSFSDKTPSNMEIAAEIGKQLSKDASLIVPKHVYTKFGRQEADFEVYNYKNAEARDSTEKMTKHLRKQADEAAKKVAEEKKAAEEAKSDVKAEEAAVEEEKSEETKEPEAKEESTPEAEEPVEKEEPTPSPDESKEAEKVIPVETKEEAEDKKEEAEA